MTIAYTVITTLDRSVEKEWVDWMRRVHLQEMLHTEKFIQALLFKKQNEKDVQKVTYVAQYLAPNREALERYYAENARDLRRGAVRFKEKSIYSRMELELIEMKK